MEILWDFPLSNSTGHNTRQLAVHTYTMTSIVALKRARLTARLISQARRSIHRPPLQRRRDRCRQLILALPVGKAAYEVIQVHATAEVLLFYL